MNTKIAQEIRKGNDGRWYILNDWYPGSLPENLEMDDLVYLDSSYSFACFHSRLQDGFKMGFASGNYLCSHFYAGEYGKISVGEFVILETTHILANKAVTIGNHCMFSWGSVITDSWVNGSTLSSETRKEILVTAAFSETRFLQMPEPKEVTIEDNVWVGFDAVILPGVRLGRGCVVGCKTVISDDVPPYAVIVGNPPAIVKYLDPDDSEEERNKAIQIFTYFGK
jgi:acetyltransferase-like isoleucine patch superfamily enzyme